MERREQDRRVRRTRKQLQAALAALTREKDLKDITVRELTELADVNRGTFYSHYKDLYDMQEQMEQELFQQLAAVLTSHLLKEGPGDLRPVLTAVFQFIQIPVKFSPERGIFNVVDRAAESAVSINGHPAPPCAQMGMVVDTEK